MNQSFIEIDVNIAHPLGNEYAVLIPPILFFLFINFCQIPFEERLLTERFGQPYAEYCWRVID